MKYDIELCLTLYAMSAEFFTGRLDLEGCLQKASELGYTGIEMVAAMTVPGYPYPTDKWIEHFNDLMKKYNLTPVCYSAYIDMGTCPDRDMTDGEIFEITLNDMMLAKKMHFQLVRTQHAIGAENFRRMIPYCKALNMPLTIEMHHPHNPELEEWKELLAVMAESDGWLGVVPDFSIFAEHPHKLHLQQAVEDFGCRPEMVDEIVARHGANEPKQTLLADPKYNDGEKFFIGDIYATYGPAHLEWLDILLPYTKYIHGKFWYMEEDCVDRVIPVDKLLPKIKAAGYKGYIASEYEGHHFDCDVDSCAQLMRWVKNSNEILGNK